MGTNATTEKNVVRRIVYNGSGTTYIVSFYKNKKGLYVVCSAVFDCDRPQRIFSQLGRAASKNMGVEEIYIRFLRGKQIGLVFKENLMQEDKQDNIGSRCVSLVETYLTEMKNIVLACGGSL